MRKYEKPILEEEKIELEDIVAVSVDESIDISDVDHVLSNATHWGR